MALDKTITGSTGYPASYFKITETKIDWLHKNAYVLLEGFKDKDARDTGKNSLIQFPYTFQAQSIPAVYTEATEEEPAVLISEAQEIPFPFSPEDNIVEKSYELIKLKSEWSEALDV